MTRKDKAVTFVDEAYNIAITGRHVEVTESMKDYAIEKISKIEKFMNRIIDVTVIMDIQRIDHKVEIIIKAGNIKITSQAVSTDMYASIDKAVARLEAQILRYKSKIQDHHAKGRAVIDMNVNVIRRPFTPEEELEMELDEEQASRAEELLKPHEVVMQEKFPLRTLNMGEAVMKMELSQDSFLIFKNEEDMKLKVIYRRRDGNYGIIEPQ